jgi:hypothetical protein
VGGPGAQKADLTMESALKALGGWTDAPWFSPSVLSDNDVVGFQFPAPPGARRQNFQIIDRSTAVKSPSSKAKNAPAKPAKRIADKLFNLLDVFGATKAIICCRTRFLFESAPILFFAEIPLAKLKPRSANKLRRDLIEIGVSACVVSAEDRSVTVMFWTEADFAITDFVQAAEPEYPIHIDFFKVPPSEPEPKTKGKNEAKTRSEVSTTDREKKLLKEVSALRQQVEKLQQSQSAIGAVEKLGLDDARLKSMLTLLHPDKHGGSEAANDAAKWINGLRDLLKGKQG